MKNKIFLITAIVVALFCVFAVSVSAAEYVDDNGIKYTLKSDGTAQVANNTAFTGTAAIVADKFTVDGVDYTVTSVASDAFKGISQLEVIYFPNTITVYEGNTFSKSNSLTAVYVDFENVTRIGSLGMTNGYDSRGYKVDNPNVVLYPTSEYGKENPTPLHTLELKSITSLGDAAFQCASPKALVFDCLTVVPTQCFRGAKFESVTVKGDVTAINGYAFNICNSLKTIVVESTVLSTIGPSAFASCVVLQSITIEMSTVTSVDASSFWLAGSKGAKSNALWYNSKGEQLVDLSAIQYINGNYAFAGSNIGSGKVIFPTALNGNYLGSLNTTDSGCFRDAGLSGTVYIDAADGYSLNIDSWAFRGNSIEKIIFGKNVVSINAAFDGEKTLKTVVFLADSVEVKSSNLFKNCSNIDFYFKELTVNTEFSQANEIVISDGSYVSYGACGFITTMVVADTQQTVTIGEVAHTTVSEIDNSFCPVGLVTVTACRFCEYKEYTLGGETIVPVAHNFDTTSGATVTNTVYKDYFVLGYNVITCANCETTKISEEATAPAIFEYYGYSCTEEAIGGTYSMSQFYGVNVDALGTYKAYGNNIEYGLVASGSANPLSYVEGELVIADKSFIKDSETFAHNFFGIKINGITEENLDKAIVFCAYVIDGDKVFYLDAGETASAVNGINFSDVLASLKEEE